MNETYRACETPGDVTCKKYYISKQVKYCLNECSGEYPTASSSDAQLCVKNCEEREQNVNGVCTKCRDGEWWDRKTGKCKGSDTACEYYNSTYLICEQKDDKVNCPMKETVNGKQECRKDCTYIMSDDANVCLSYCPEAYSFITAIKKDGKEVKVCNPQCATEFHKFVEKRTNSQGEEYEIYVCESQCDKPSVFGSVNGQHSKYCAASCKQIYPEQVTFVNPDRECVSQCRSDVPLYDSEYKCISSCPGVVVNSRECVSECPASDGHNGRVVYVDIENNKHCSTCTSSFHKVVYSKQTNTYSISCVEECLSSSNFF